MTTDEFIIKEDDLILVTGASGFIGSRVVSALLDRGFTNLRCFARPTSNLASLDRLIESYKEASVDIVRGDLTSPKDCDEAVSGVAVVYHLAAGMGKSFEAVYESSVVATKNLLEAIARHGAIRRLVSVSSFTVYSNMRLRAGALLDESCDLESDPRARGEAYCYGKVTQEELVVAYCRDHGIRHVILRPGVVYGPGRREITGRVGIYKRGIFLHMGGSNVIPFTYVDNCADAIVLAGLKDVADGEVFNVVDDDLPTSREFLELYRKHVGSFRAVSVPRFVSYLLCYLVEKRARSRATPPSLNRNRWAADWKGNTYSNEKLKRTLGWKPKVPAAEAMLSYFKACRAEASE